LPDRSPAIPDRILEIFAGYWNTEALKAAIELDLFTFLAKRSLTLAELGEKSGAKRELLGRLCDYLGQLGLIRKKLGRYSAARDAARFLNRESPYSLCALAGFFTSPILTRGFSELTNRIKTGRTALAGDRLLEPDSPAWSDFARGAWPLRMREAKMIVRALEKQRLVGECILELGCGGAPLAITLLKRHPGLSAVAQDWPHVLAVAREHGAEAGLADRIDFLPGDARTIDFAGPYDMVLMMCFLDYFDAATRLALLHKVHAVLRPGGIAAVYAPLLPEEGESWPAIAYNFLLLAASPAGEASTFAQIKALLKRAGFGRVLCRSDMPLVTARKPILPSRRGSYPRYGGR
jgi:SAM-dependent methyltransferase